MAEGGGDEPSENPFSFKKFVQNKDGSSSGNMSEDGREDEEDVFDLPDLGMEPDKDKGAASDDEKLKRKDKSDENPFSFKKFIMSGARPKTRPNGPGSGNGALSTLDLASDLPDFVQDHFNGDNHMHRLPRLLGDIPLPDFVSQGNSQKTGIDLPDPAGSVEPGNLQVDLGDRLHPDGLSNGHGAVGDLPDIHPNDLHSNNDHDVSPLPSPPMQNKHTGGLPDFISDSAVNSIDLQPSLDRSYPAVSDDFMYQPNGQYELELKRVREENRQLRMQLEEARSFAETESKRVADVLREMEAIEKRESEETEALEKMVQQVEANLAVTTQRAVAAENTVTKLKQEVRSLQGQLSVLRSENEALRSGNPSDPVKEKAKYASEQLAAAAKTAESTLKQLMTGVETIKLVSDVLASIDKISEDGSTAEGVNDEPLEGATGGTGAAM